jgi:hypothetical protein
MMSRALRFLWLLLLAVPAVLPAQTPIGGDILVSHARQDQFDPRVSVGPRGDFVVSWLRETSQGFALYARRYAASGAPASGEILVAGSPADSSGVAIARDGSFVVVFTHGAAATQSLYARWYGPNGAFRGSTVVAAQVVDREIAVASRPDGRFAAIYYAPAGVAVRAFGADRAPLGPQSLISSGTVGFPLALSLGLDGEMTAAWQEIVPSSPTEPHYHLRARHLAADGAPLADSFLVVPGEVLLVGIHAGADRDGNLLFLWTAVYPTPDGQSGLFVRPFTADGTPLGAAVNVAGTESAVFFGAAVDPDPEAGFVTAWIQQDSPVRNHVSVRRFSADGLPLGPLLKANGYAAPEQFGPVLAAGPDGSFVVAWMSGPSHTTDILVRRFRR